nr:PREDICTED: uncharacterized protein LOC109029715 [Bemisia tabaci]
MNQVMSYNSYNPIINPMSNTYSPPVTPTRPCDLSYFPTGPRSDFGISFDGQAQYGETLSKWVPDPSPNEKRHKNYPTPMTSEDKPMCGSLYGEPSPIFGEAKFGGPSSSEMDESEGYDEAKFTDSNNSNLEFADSPEFDRSRPDETYDEKYAVRINNNNNLEYDKRVYQSDRYVSPTDDYFQANFTYTPHPHVAPKLEIYDMDRELDPYAAASSQLYPQPSGAVSLVGAPGALQILDGPPPPRKRNTANKKERKRTLTLNKAFSLLRACIPNVPTDTKLSKIKTLKLAKEYIIFLLETLKSSDPKAWAEGFKADKALYSPRKSQQFKTTLKAYNENTDANQVTEARKSKGRTGWPQDVWAYELKPQQFSSPPPVRI